MSRRKVPLRAMCMVVFELEGRGYAADDIQFWCQLAKGHEGEHEASSEQERHMQWNGEGFDYISTAYTVRWAVTDSPSTATNKTNPAPEDGSAMPLPEGVMTGEKGFRRGLGRRPKATSGCRRASVEGEA